MTVLARSLALVSVVGLVGAACATAARQIVPFGTYRGTALKGAKFVIASSGSSARFHGSVEVELGCRSEDPSTGTATEGQIVIVLNASSAPKLKIDNSDGTFTGTRLSRSGTVTISGKFSGDARTMVFAVKSAGCSSSKYTFHYSARPTRDPEDDD